MKLIFTFIEIIINVITSQNLSSDTYVNKYTPRSLDTDYGILVTFFLRGVVSIATLNPPLALTLRLAVNSEWFQAVLNHTKSII